MNRFATVMTRENAMSFVGKQVRRGGRVTQGQVATADVHKR